MEDTGRATLQDLRRMLGVLRRDQREEQLEPTMGLAGADQLVARSRATGMDVTIHVGGELDDMTASNDVATARILQRLLELARAGRPQPPDHDRCIGWAEAVRPPEPMAGDPGPRGACPW